MTKTTNISNLTRYKPSAKECALLLLRLIEEREERRKKSMTRAQISPTTLKQLWRRQRLTDQLLDDVREWLLTAGWTLFDGGGVYGAIKSEAVGNWPSLAAYRIKNVLTEVSSGEYQFGKLERLLPLESDKKEPTSGEENPDEESEEE